tara:strand:- start:2554 stop:3117 length:564 start_codon:yes stop_codon:yes gene_type:complete
MKSPFYFMVTPVDGRRYNNTKNLSGTDIVVSTSEEDHKFSNRFAEVIETPLGYNGPIETGDTLLVHHNAFKFYNDIKGNRRSGKSFFKDDIFFIETEQFFLYKKGAEWHTYDRYCFVAPIPSVDYYIKKTFLNEPLRGIMRYPNDYLISQGVSAGDHICFTPNSDYEFEVDGEKLYRIYDHQITIKL